MAIGPIEFRFLKAARDRGYFSGIGSILDFGETAVHNIDMPTAIRSLISGEAALASALGEAGRIAHLSKHAQYDLARFLYRLLYGDAEYLAVDLDPRPPYVVQQDLNVAFDLGRRFDLCVNNGTSEHILNQLNFYKAMHDHTRAGGLLMHWTPGIGWINHGLFHAQPDFFFDLAVANQYEILLACLSTNERLYHLERYVDESMVQQLPDLAQALICTLMRKTADANFQVPLQGAYGHLTKYLKR